MNQIKKTYIIDWSGPYTIDNIKDYIDSAANCIYLISGLQKYQRGSEQVQYCGITQRDVIERLEDEYHHIKEVPRDCQIWVGRFANPLFRRNRRNLELVEHLLIYYEKPYLNDKKTKSPPKEPVVVVNRWRDTNDKYRQRRLYAVQEIPDVIMFDGEEFWKADRLIKNKNIQI